MSVRETSLDAYRALESSGSLQDQEWALMRLVHLHFPLPARFTRKELAMKTGWTINRICGRVFSLLEKGYLAEQPEIRDGGHLLRISESTDAATAQPAPEKRVTDDSPEKPGSSRAAVLHIGGQALEVVDERLVHAHGRSREGKPISFSYTAVTVREQKPRRAA